MIKHLLILFSLTSSCAAMQIHLSCANRLAELRVKVVKETNPAIKVKIESEIHRLEYMAREWSRMNTPIYYASRDHMLHEGE